jgi:cytoskeletal protein RodZ
MSRFIKILLTIILIIAIILLGAWIMSRKKAADENRSSPTFRQFLGLGTAPAKTPEGQSPTDLTPDQVTNEPTGSTGPTTPEGGTGTGSTVAVSQFTTSPLTPTQGAGAPIKPASALPSAPNIQTPVLPPATIVSAPTTTTGSQCTDSDVTIEFTADEITRLNALQGRFLAIAQNLHTDSDATAELANFDSFKTKLDAVGELYAYCQEKSPLIGAPAYRTRVATPFWRNPAKDVAGYIAPNGVISMPVDSRDTAKTYRLLEKVFRVNFW